MLVKKREENLVGTQLDSTYIVLTQLELCMKKKKNLQDERRLFSNKK